MRIQILELPTEHVGESIKTPFALVVSELHTATDEATLMAFAAMKQNIDGCAGVILAGEQVVLGETMVLGEGSIDTELYRQAKVADAEAAEMDFHAWQERNSNLAAEVQRLKEANKAANQKITDLQDELPHIKPRIMVEDLAEALYQVSMIDGTYTTSPSKTMWRRRARTMAKGLGIELTEATD